LFLQYCHKNGARYGPRSFAAVAGPSTMELSTSIAA